MTPPPETDDAVATLRDQLAHLDALLVSSRRALESATRVSQLLLVGLVVLVGLLLWRW